MPEFAPLFTENGSVLPKNTQPLTSSRVITALAAAAVGAAPGGAASATNSRRRHPTNVNEESKPVIETDTQLSRVTTAADVTALKTLLTKDNKNTTKKPSFGFVADKSGNGGKAFTRS